MIDMAAPSRDPSISSTSKTTPPKQSKVQGASGNNYDENLPFLDSYDDDFGTVVAVEDNEKGHERFTHRLVDVRFIQAFLISGFVGMMIWLCMFLSFSKPFISKKSSTCTTPECVHAASEILYNLDPKWEKLDPCADFNKFVCSGWEDRHDLRPDQGDAFTGTMMAENSQTILRHLLEAPYSKSFAGSSDDQDNFEKIKDAYDACMDLETIKQKGFGPMMEILHKVLEIYSNKENSHNTWVKKQRAQELMSAPIANDLTAAVLYLNEIGVNALVGGGVGADDKDPDTVVIQINAPWAIGLPSKEYYNDTKIVARYTDMIAEIIDLLHHEEIELVPSSSGDAGIKNFAKALVDFETKLAAASPATEDVEDVTKYYNPRTLEETEALVPELSFSSIIMALAPSGYSPQKIIVGSPSYLIALSETLKYTSRDIIQGYFIWKVMQAYVTKVESDVVKPLRRFKNELQGKAPDAAEERWRTCVREIDSGLGWILSHFFVEKAFSEKAREFGDRIVSDIKDRFIDKLKVSTWMDKSVIKLAIQKVHNIVQKIGFPTKSPNIMDAAKLKAYYSTVNVSPSEFFKNAVSMAGFDTRHEWSALGKPTDRDAWDMTVPTVNAYYNPAGNEIVFPAGIMQFPVFDVNVPEYLSYGAFGAVSGHELSHAFDSTGRHYDRNGNYTDWWTNTTVAAFKEKAQCFIDQYSKFSVPGPDDKPLHVNGRLTLGENIADAGGITASFAAWKIRDKKNPGQSLPGLEKFTKEQLFFVSYGTWWCGKSRKEAAIQRIYTDPHAPKWARILGTMANSKDFAESFNCPVKKPTCELW